MFFLTTHSTERGVANRAESWYAAATQVATRMQCFLRNSTGVASWIPTGSSWIPIDAIPLAGAWEIYDILVMLFSVQKRTVGDRIVPPSPPPFPRTNTPASACHRATSDLFPGNF